MSMGEMADSEENNYSPKTVCKPKSSSEIKEPNPLGISRYGRTRKPKVSLDFCDIDVAINDNADDFVKPIKSPIKASNKSKIIQPTNINGMHIPIKESLAKAKHRTTHNNNNTEILHITGDSDISDTYTCQLNENLSKSVLEETKSTPVPTSLSVTKEKILDIKDKQLSEELKPILSEEIFQTPSIDVAEVFKIISNKSNDFEMKTTKHNSKGTLKTYANKRRSFQRQSSLIESFGLPDEPIIPLDSDKFIKPLRISEIDVDIVKPEAVNLIDRDLIDSLWKIGSVDDDCICHEDRDILNIPIFDIRSRFTPEKDIGYKNKDYVENRADKTPVNIYSHSSNNKRERKYNVLKSNMENTTLNNYTPLLKENEEKKASVIKKIITKNDDSDIKSFNQNNDLVEFSKSKHASVIIKKDQKRVKANQRNSPLNSCKFDLDIPKKGICALVYERNNDDSMLNMSKESSSEDICDMEDHIKISLIDKQNKAEIVQDPENKQLANKIDINKLKNQINSRIELVKSDEERVTAAQNTVPEDKILPPNIENTSSKALIPEQINYGLGDLMWAKIGKYPYWPCIVMKDPETKEYRKSKYRNITNYHVRFFGDNGRRSWISNKYLLPYNTDLNKIQKERKYELILPHKKSKSYQQWLVGTKEADGLSDKGKKEKLEFFKQLFVNKRQKQRSHSNLRIKMKAASKSRIHKRIIKPIGTRQLEEEMLQNLTEIRDGNVLRRTTRSSMQGSSSTKSLSDAKDDIKDVDMADEDSKKADLSFHSFEDEVGRSKSFLPLTLQSQIALYKRNNLFKGVPRDRVCQICEKPEGVIKCKGRCNGYYHTLCASKKKINNEHFKTSNNIHAAVVFDNKIEKNMSTREENTLGIKEKDTKEVQNNDLKHSIQTRQKSKIALSVCVRNMKNNEQNVEVLEQKSSENSGRGRRKSTVPHNYEIRRITRSQSQEREVLSRESKEEYIKEEIVECGDRDLPEVEISSVWSAEIKEEIESEQGDVSVYTLKEGKPSEVIENRRRTRSVVSAEINKDKLDKKSTMEKLSKMNKDAPITIYKKPEILRSCNVKIVNIRKKSGQLPKLVLNQDPTMEKLPLHDKIDRKMEEVMQQIEKKPPYADSTTDYTSSEESAVDLLSQHSKSNDSRDNGTTKAVSEDDADKRRIKSIRVQMQQPEVEFRCAECVEDIDHICFVCHEEISRKGSGIRLKCSLFACGKFYHPECLKAWPQTQWSLISTTKHKQSNEMLDTFVCPVHVCHTCVSDDPRAAIPRCTSDKVVKCLRCPATYHNSAYCIPAGTAIYSSTQIVCPRHFIPKKYNKKAMPIINTTWCFICSEGGDLVCCETCPTSVHSECLKINLSEDDSFICEDCETGRFPLYDEIVWVKLGHYRWWPGVILFPNEVPERVRAIKHSNGEFVVRFFGTHDHYWVSRGRVFLFQEGDSAEAAIAHSRKKTDRLFRKSVQEATEAHRIKKEFKQTIVEEAAVKVKHKPPHYIKIKVNRPVGNVRQFDGNISNTTPCECDPKSKNPCSADSDCLNRLLLTECNPEVCPAGEKCQNQNFEKRKYPPLVPYRTESRGWGLKSLEPIKKGEFVIEYVGEMIDEQEYQRRIKKMHEQKEENYYFLTIDKDRMLDAGPKGNVARFMNHSCQPNCETQKWTVNGDTRVGLFAVSDILPNTELTFNYNLECVGKEKKICKCGAPNCSGFIGLKTKQEEPRKRSKSKLRNKRKKSSPAPEPINNKPCFVCCKDGDVTPCNNKICTKSYHLKCIKLCTAPDSKWTCPWHNCNICTKRTIRCCIKCINSYCPVHSEGNIRHDKLLGFVCSEHDPIKESSLDTNLEDCASNDRPSPLPKNTEENDVTSTTCDEYESSSRQPPEDRMLYEITPRKSIENGEIVTSTPIKSPAADNRAKTEEIPPKRRRGRPSLSESAEIPDSKKAKNDRYESKLEGVAEEKRATSGRVRATKPRVVRNLRTLRVVNYSGTSDRIKPVQGKLASASPVRKKSTHK